MPLTCNQIMMGKKTLTSRIHISLKESLRSSLFRAPEQWAKCERERQCEVSISLARALVMYDASSSLLQPGSGQTGPPREQPLWPLSDLLPGQPGQTTCRSANCRGRGNGELKLVWERMTNLAHITHINCSCVNTCLNNNAEGYRCSGTSE